MQLYKLKNLISKHAKLASSFYQFFLSIFSDLTKEKHFVLGLFLNDTTQWNPSIRTSQFSGQLVISESFYCGAQVFG